MSGYTLCHRKSHVKHVDCGQDVPLDYRTCVTTGILCFIVKRAHSILSFISVDRIQSPRSFLREREREREREITSIQYFTFSFGGLKIALNFIAINLNKANEKINSIAITF